MIPPLLLDIKPGQKVCVNKMTVLMILLFYNFIDIIISCGMPLPWQILVYQGFAHFPNALPDILTISFLLYLGIMYFLGTAGEGLQSCESGCCQI